MKSWKLLMSNLCYLTLIIFVFMVTPVHSFAEEVLPLEEAEVGLTDTMASAPVDNSDKSNVKEKDKVKDKPKKNKEEEPEEPALEATAMSSTTTGSGGEVEGPVSSVMIPEPSMFTGSATTKIPIILPPGRGGIAPNLALVYNSSKRNGWIGVGWDLDMGAIQRSTKHGLKYDEDDYVVVSNGSSSELVDQSSEWGSGYYGAKIEGSFTKYHKSSNNWTVTTKDGTKYYYGTTSASRQYDPADTSRVFKWCLDKVEDTNGNFMTIDYYKDQGEIYLERIDYTDNNTGVSSNNYVIFSKDTQNRTDNYAKYISHFEVITADRLKTIEVYGNGQLARKYELAYTYSPNTGSSLLSSIVRYGSDGTTDLPAITFEWKEGQEDFSDMTPWATYSYAYQNQPRWGTNSSGDYTMLMDMNGDMHPDHVHHFNYSTGQSGLWVRLNNGEGFEPMDLWASYSYAHQNRPRWWSASVGEYTTLIDINNDGKPDHVHHRNYTTAQYGLWVALNNGSSFDPMTRWTSYTKTQQNQPKWSNDRGDYTALIDMNGDGYLDHVHHYNYSTYQYGLWVALNNGSGFNQMSMWATYPNVYQNQPRGSGVYGDTTVLKDMNNDGLPDHVHHYNYSTNQPGLWVALNNGNGFDAMKRWANYPNTYQNMPRWYGDYGDYTVLQDMNGDGLPDHVHHYNYSTQQYGLWVALNNGEGFEPMEQWAYYYYDNQNRPRKGSVYGNVTELKDINGDGLPDHVHHYNYSTYQSGVWVRINNGSGLDPMVSWEQYIKNYQNMPYWLGDYGDYTVMRDMNADGLLDHVHHYNYSTSTRGLWVSLNLSKLDLLAKVNNLHSGSSFDIEYKPSSKYNNTNLPFIVQTVSEITVDDGLGNEYQTTYDYEGGLYEAEDRDFRGFGWAAKTNPDSTVEKTTFLQGDYDKGRQEKIEFFASEGGALLNDTLFDWDDPVTIGRSKFVKLNSKQSKLYDGATTVETEESYTYDNSNGNLLTTVASGPDAQTLTTSKEYDNFGGSGGWVWRMTEESLSGSISGTVRKTVYDYEMYTGNLESKTFCLDISQETGPTIDYVYDTYGNLIKEYDPLNNFTEMVYDTATQTYPVIIKYPKTASGTITHNIEKTYNYKFGSVSGEKDENGNWTYYFFEEFGRIDQVDFPGGGQTITEYHDDVVPNYIVTKVKETSGSTIDKYVYVDGLGREKQTVALGENSKRIRTLNTYDHMGRISEVAGPYFYGTSFAYSPTLPAQCPKTQTLYDERGRPEIVQSNDTYWGWNQTEFTYNGLATTITDPDGKQKTERKDYLGRLIQVIEYNGSHQYNTYYEYNAAGDLLEVRDHHNTTTTMQYDSLGRKTRMTDPDMGTWQYSSYDANGNLLTQKNSRNVYTHFEYDELNRITKKYYSNTYTPTNYTYDNLSIPNGRGRLASMSNSKAKTVYNEYDEVGRITSLTKTITGDRARTTTYYYDLSGKMTQMGYPDGFQVYYEYYPGTGLLDTVSGSDFLEYANFSNYEPTGKIGQIDHENDTQTIYQYDPESTRLTKITTHDPSGQAANDIQRRRYEYTGAGDIDTIVDERDGNKTYTYDYDGLHRLTYERVNGAVSAMYTYNAIGNIMSKTVGSDTYTYTYHATKKHAVSNINLNGNNYAFTYDNTGNMRNGYDLSDPSDAAIRNIYPNVENMPWKIVHIKGGKTTVSRFIYDGESRRVKKWIKGGGETVYYIGDHMEKINGSLVKYIFAGDMRIARIKGSEKRIFHKDHLGSSTAITDMNGNEIETSNYMPFGSLRSHTLNYVSDYKFTDQELDTATGLYNYGARLYDPAIGRFIAADTIVQSPGDPQTLNRYSYCRNNPLIYTDPGGHLFGIDDLIVGAIFGAIIGGTTSAVTDGDIGMGMLTGAIGGAFFGAAGGIIENSITQAAASAGISFEAAAAAGLGMSSYAQASLHFAAGAMSGGVNAALTGSNVGLGMLTGGISGGIGKYAGGFLPSNYGAQLLGRSFVGGVTGGITAEIYGGSFAYGFTYGAKTGAIGFMCNDLYHDIKRAYNRAYHSEMGKGTRFGFRSAGVVIRETFKMVAVDVTLSTLNYIPFSPGVGFWVGRALNVTVINNNITGFEYMANSVSYEIHKVQVSIYSPYSVFGTGTDAILYDN